MTEVAHRDLKLASVLSGCPIGDVIADLARREVTRIGTTLKKSEKR
jgi:hypothetical protein